MVATWNAVDGADRYIYSLRDTSSPADEEPLYKHVETKECAVSLILEADKSYKLAIASVPFDVVDTEANANKCSWTEVVFKTDAAGDSMPKVLSVITNASGKVFLPGDIITATIICNKYTVDLKVSGAEGTLSKLYFDEYGRNCFDYAVSFAVNGAYQINFTAVDPIGKYDQTLSGVLNVTVCDHTLGSPVLVGKSEPTPYNGAEHLVILSYEKTCLCGKVTEPYTEEALIAHDEAPATLKYKSTHEKMGHRKYYICSCSAEVLLGGTPPTKDSYYSYIEALGSSNKCSACRAIYEEQKLIKELQTLLKKRGYDLGTYGPNKDGIDGDFGTKTKEAINDFRNRVMGLGAISNVYEVDKATWDALRNGVKEEVSENEELLVPGECSVYASGHKMVVEYTNEHPHAYLKCACGKTTPSNVESLSCCECGYHEWSEPQYISGTLYKEICMRGCGETRNVAAPAQQFANDLFVQNVINNRDKQSYTRNDGSTGTSSTWLSVAYSATDKLTENGYVWTNATLNTFSDPTGSTAKALADAINEDEWNEQKVKLWENILSDMLTGMETSSSSNNAAQTSAGIVQTGIDAGGMFGNVENAIYDGLDLIVEQATGTDVDWDVKDVDNWKLQDSTITKLADSWANKDWDWKAEANSWGSIEVGFIALNAYFAGTSAADQVKEDQEALRKILLDADNSISSLQNIINSTNNPQLIEAAKNLMEDIDKERNEACGIYWTKISDCLNEIERDAAATGAAAQSVATSAGNHYINAVAPFVAILSTSASIGKMALNWGASFESAQTLMTYSIMESELNIVHSLSDCDTMAATNDMIQLWYSLQINGSEAATKFAKDYEAGLGLGVDQLNLTNCTTIDALTTKLERDIKSYQTQAGTLQEYCENNLE